MSKVEPVKSGLTGWVLAIIRALRASGIEVDPVLEEIGIDAERLQGGYGRYSQEKISELWRRAVTLTEPDFAIRVAAEVRPSTFHVVGFAMNCSANLSRSLHRFAHYCRLISDSATAILTESSEDVHLQIRIDTGGTPPIYQTMDTVLASVVAFLRWISGEHIVPLEVRMDHPNPDDGTAYEDFFGCPVHYSAGKNLIVFRKSDLEKPVPGGDEELASLLDGVANRHLEARMTGRLAVRVRDILIRQMQYGKVGKSDIAKVLAMTERTLLRRLKDEGTTFSDILYRVRLELAFQLLRDPDMTVREVAYALGYSDEGTFSRAFKRWTGRRPSTITHLNSDEFLAASNALTLV